MYVMGPRGKANYVQIRLAQVAGNVLSIVRISRNPSITGKSFEERVDIEGC